jgi:regulatory protein
LIDDQAFANDWSRSRHIYKGLSRNVLARELRQKGVGDIEITVALEQIAPESERAVATALVEKKLRSLQRESSEVRYRRISGFLARKGYSHQLISQILRDTDL